MCAELADLAMQLARAAAARTLADWAEPEAPPTAEPLVSPSAEPPFTQAAQPHPDREAAPPTTPTPRRPTARAASTEPHKPTDPAVLFTRLAATVRDCIALEARLSAAAAAPAAPSARIQRADPRREPVCEAIRYSIENHPGRAELMREATTRLDEQLAADPDQAIDAAHLLFELCDEFGIELDLAKLPDEILFAFPETTDQDDGAPDPRATSPP